MSSRDYRYDRDRGSRAPPRGYRDLDDPAEHDRGEDADHTTMTEEAEVVTQETTTTEEVTITDLDHLTVATTGGMDGTMDMMIGGIIGGTKDAAIHGHILRTRAQRHGPDHLILELMVAEGRIQGGGRRKVDVGLVNKPETMTEAEMGGVTTGGRQGTVGTPGWLIRITSLTDAVSSVEVIEDGNMEVDDEMDEEAKMQALMGFGGFDSTKGKKVAGTDVSAVAVNKQRTYRQYMNRRRGFNRNLSPTR
ncbi:hypothetical protein HK097_003298 [Rhizophlyctis rosea]|uniref:U4/U6.U5 small nuclear ribonucleoprotein 27kDa protein domain-containing protein n=1 Tax=Rhizophlyctis rosea TaxID=64517 RepID=A0AAD5X6V7_9FUNG|nr:hypothetical protein HK097_003298 [Rhizophlyctis rosea]